MKKAIATPAPLPIGSAAERLNQVQTVLHRQADAGRHQHPKLIAISKNFNAQAIQPLIDAGHRRFGENRVQEAIAKWPSLLASTPGIELHLVGQLQSNKAAEAVAHFDAIHSLDRSSLVRALAKACATAGRQPMLLAQVKLDDEPQKGGVTIESLPGLLAEASALGLHVAGLMTVPPADKDPAPYFALLAKLARQHKLPECSMGMSGDYDLAARLGATFVRIGTALFGPRS